MIRNVLLLLFSLVPVLAQEKYNCGGLNQRTCTTNDFERTNMSPGESRLCERDLDPEDGFCKNKSRDTTFTRNKGWEGWATENQLYSIGKDAPINFITWPATHNAFSNRVQGFNSWLYTNQALSITDQLNLGSRHLELDPKNFVQFFGSIPLADAALRVCHASSVAYCLVNNYGSRLFGFVLKEIADWTDANPGQVVYIKIDNESIASEMSRIELEVAMYLGNRVFPVPANASTLRWPTLQEIRNAGKSIIVVRHNKSSFSGTAVNVWSADGLVQVSNWPTNQNFKTCVAYDGYDPSTRSTQAPRSWWDVAEGRAITNGQNTGFFWEDTVADAANCGVSVIGLDFFNALNDSLNVSRLDRTDYRLKEMVWSWSEGDYGRNGPAYQEPSTGTWVSFNSSQVLPIACAIKRPYGSPLQDRGWKITSSSIPWNLAAGNARCAEEFNASGVEYEFAFPTNGWQNKKLREVAAGQKVWLGYSLVPTPNASFSATELTYNISPGGPVPLAKTLRISAAPGTTIEGKTVGNVPIAYTLPSSPFSNGETNLSIAIAPAASALASGEYNGTLDLTLTAPFSTAPQILNLKLKLVVRRSPTMTAASSLSTAVQGASLDLTAILQNVSSPTGTIKFYRILDSNGVPTGQETVAAADLVGGADRVKPSVNNLPLGRNTYVAVYSGDGSHLESESDPFTITITPRIVASPATITFNRTGGATPPNQTVALSNLGASPVVEYPGCSWIVAAIQGSNLVARLGDPGLALGVGSYTCDLLVRDALTNQGLGSTVVVARLNVQTNLSAQPSSISQFGNTSVSLNVNVNAASGGSVPITVASPQNWILLEPLPSAGTPLSVRVVIDPSSLPIGVSNGQVIVSSALAPNLVIPVSYNKVNPTVVTSIPAGRTVTVDGTNVTTPASFVWQPGSSHSIGASSPQLNNGTRYKLTGWQGFPSQPFNYTAVANGATLTANFDVEYLLTTDVAPTNAGTISRNMNPADSYYSPGTTVQLTANPAANFSFNGWLGALSGSNPVGSVTMSGPQSVVANFSQIQPVQVTISSMALGATVTVDGTTYTLPANLLWVPGRSYQIAAANSVGGSTGTQFFFANWSNGGAISQTIVAPQTPLSLVVNYRRQFLLSASSSPQLAGSVSGGGWYDEGSTVSLQATAASGYVFSNFSGDLTGSTNPGSVVMRAPRTVVANYAPAGLPSITVLTGSPRIDGPVAGQRIVPIVLRNTGVGIGRNVRITGVSGISILAGTGGVELLSPTPIAIGDLNPSSSATANLLFSWPASAQRIRMTINYALDNGTPGSMALTILR